MKHATGDFVYFFDSDDELFPEALEKMYNNAISNNRAFQSIRKGLIKEQ